MTVTSPTDHELLVLVARIDGAAVRAKDVHEISSKIGVTPEERNGALGALAMAFQYGTGKEPSGTSSYFTEMYGFHGGSRYPPSLNEIPEDVWDLWERAAKIVAEPLALARLHDLCFCGRSGNVGDHAQEAASQYLQVVASLEASHDGRSTTVVALRKCEYLRRARALGRLTGRKTTSDNASAAIISALESVSEKDPFDVGSAIVLVDAAVDENISDTVIDNLLDRLRTDSTDIFLTERVIRLQLRRASDDQRMDLHRQLVAAWLAEADRSDQSRRVWNLTTASERARDFGLADEQAAITTKLQETELSDHGLVHRRVTVPVNAADAEAYVQSFTNQLTWQDALMALLSGNPPTGGVGRNRVAADAMVTEAPLVSALPVVLLGGDGLPRFNVNTVDEKSEWRLTRCELTHLQILGPWTDEALRRIGVKWTPIDVDDISAFLAEEPHTSSQASAALARAFNHYFNGDFEAAAYVATPQIERIVRDAVLAVNEPAYRLQRGAQPGQYAGLGALIPVLFEAGVDESWLRFIQTTLCTPLGLNYRNELLHGFVDDVPSGKATLILLAGLYLSRGITLDLADGLDPDPATI